MSSSVPPLRRSSLDWCTSHWHSSRLRNIQFLSQLLSHDLHLFKSVWTHAQLLCTTILNCGEVSCSIGRWI